MGISNDTHVVIYDNNAKFGFYSAGRAWWLFKVRPGKLDLLFLINAHIL